MFKRIAAITLMLGAVLAINPAIGAAQEYDRGYDRGRSEYRDRDNRGREFRENVARERARREREIRNRFESNRYQQANRGYYDRLGCWHSY